MILRAYQQAAVENLRRAYAAGRKSPCLVMPTGSGKTPTAAEIIRLARQRSKRVLFAAGRVELLDQAVRKLADAGISNVRVIQAENDSGGAGDVTVASVPTLATPRWRANPVPADLLILDECQHGKARTWLEIAQGYPLRLGLTATPERGDGSPLGDLFDELVVGATVAELTQLGHLVPCRVFAPPVIMDARTLAMEPVDAYQRHCPGTKSVVFATMRKHAQLIAAAFRSAGIGAEAVDGDMPERSEILARHAAGEFPVLVNVNLVVEGYDDPSIESVVFARRFTYPGGYLQAIGRALRPSPGKASATVIDLCGSALVHGTPDAERTYSLDGKAISTQDRKAIRQCASCGGVSVARAECPYCAAEFPTATRALPTSNGAGVGEIGPKQRPSSWPMRAKKRGLCAGCGRETKPGDWIVYSRVRRLAMHTACAHAAAKARGAAA